MNRIPNLDPLRFILAAFVVLFHVPLVSASVDMPHWGGGIPLFSRGKDAVYVFFVLSGFLITLLLLKEKNRTGTLSIRNFYVRRILRIWPVYFLVLFIGLTYYNVLLPLFGVAYETDYSLGEALFFNVLFMPNVFGVHYHAGAILSILWSIGIEEQFYLFWAPFLRWLNLRRVPAVLAGFAVLYSLLLWASPWGRILVRYDMFFHYFAVGGLFATWTGLRFEGKLFSRTLQILAVTAFAAYFTTDLFHALMPSWLLRSFDAVLFSYLLLNFGFNPNRLFTIRSRVFIYLGRISYGIYMYHMIALNFVLFLFIRLEFDTRFGFAGSVLMINVGTFLLTIPAAALSYEWYERFFLNLKDRFRPRVRSVQP